MATALAPLNAHLALIKRRLLIIGCTIMVFFILAFTYAADLIEWFSRPFEDPLIFYGPTEALFAAIKVSFLAGIVLSLPVIFYQSWKFIEPALLPREQRWAIPMFLLATMLFALGLVFSNLVILPRVIDFFVSFGEGRDIQPELAVGIFVDFNVKFMLIMGFAFEIPLILTLLARGGYVTVELLGQYRKHAAMVALIISAIVTPDATMYTMLLMAIPLMVMYELGVLGARTFGRPRKTPPSGETASGDSGGNDGEGDATTSQAPPVPTGTAGYRVR